jgi:hypothetical protein
MSQFFGKLLYADFPKFEDAIGIADYTKKIDDKMAGLDKIRKVISEKSQALDKKSSDYGVEIGKLNEELNIAFGHEIEMANPPKIKREWLAGLSIKPIEAKLLVDHKMLYEEPTEPKARKK